MNLWDFNIEEIPCSWNDIYEEALEECPQGKEIFDMSICEKPISSMYHQ